MQTIHGYSQIHQSYSKVVVTVGNFDGLHLGHRAIIESVLKQAKDLGGISLVYTFRPHPHIALQPAAELQLINTYDEKLSLLEAMGVDVVVEEPFSREFSSITPDQFLNDVLIKKLSPAAIWVGYDFGFGRNRAGDLSLMQDLCGREGIELHVAKPFQIAGEVCSSSRIRDYLQAGEVKKANLLLGREFFYRGIVVRGQGRGHKIGFATANVHLDAKVGIKEGVYASRTVWNGQSFPSVTNIGRQPTFNTRNLDSIGKPLAPVVLETHLLNFNEDIYGEKLEVRLVEHLRDEVRFSGVESLVAQIRKDVDSAQRILSFK